MKHLIGWFLIMVAAFCETYAALVVKLRFNTLGDINFNSVDLFIDYMTHFFQSPLLITGGIAFMLAPAAWFIALNRIQLSVGYPVLVALHLVFVTIFGVAVLGEAFSLNKVIGFLFVMVSLYFFRHVE